MSVVKKLLESEGAAAEAGVDAPLKPGTKVTRGHGRSRTLQVRLNYAEYAELEEFARIRGLPPSTLARSIIVASLHGAADTPAARIERVRHELELLSREIA